MGGKESDRGQELKFRSRLANQRGIASAPKRTSSPLVLFGMLLSMPAVG